MKNGEIQVVELVDQSLVLGLRGGRSVVVGPHLVKEMLLRAQEKGPAAKPS